MRRVLARLALMNGARLGWALSIAFHAALLGVATAVAVGTPRGGGVGGAGDEGEQFFTLDLRAGSSASSNHSIAPAPQTESEAPTPPPELDTERAVDDRSALDGESDGPVVIDELASVRNALATTVGSAFAALARASHEARSTPHSSASADSAARSTISSPPVAGSIVGRAGAPASSAQVGDGDPLERAVLLDGPAPAYPLPSRRAGEQGDVRCSIHVRADGGVDAVDVVHSSGSERLDAAARAALLRWRFRPAQTNGVASPCDIEHTVTFRLR